jgi:uncharacterized membrane protein
MKKQQRNEVMQAVVLGAVAGLRSMMAPALYSHVAEQGSNGRGQSRLLEWMASPLTMRAFQFLSAGELFADKLPNIPSRVSPGPLVGRALSGALVGGAVYNSAKKPIVTGILIGSVAAVAGAYAGYHLRRLTKETLHLPDTVVALAEDALALKAGTSVL